MNKQIILGGGCFWCLEAIFQRVRGVKKVVSGYSGGTVDNPTYRQVCGGETGHAEVIKIEFDDQIISLAELLEIFWHLHDPTTPNRQGADVGTQYRSIVFYENEDDKSLIQKVKMESQTDWPQPIVTQIQPLEKFYEAEANHQNYFNNNPQNGYCNLVISPKLSKLKEKYLEKLN